MACSPMNNMCLVSGYGERGPTSWERKREGLRESRRLGTGWRVEGKKGLGQLHAVEGLLFCLALWFCIFLISKTDSGSGRGLCRLNCWFRFLLLRNSKLHLIFIYGIVEGRRECGKDLEVTSILHFTDAKFSAWKSRVICLTTSIRCVEVWTNMGPKPAHYGARRQQPLECSQNHRNVVSDWEIYSQPHTRNRGQWWWSLPWGVFKAGI